MGKQHKNKCLSCCKGTPQYYLVFENVVKLILDSRLLNNECLRNCGYCVQLFSVWWFGIVVMSLVVCTVMDDHWQVYSVGM